jgi:putative transposase
MHCSGTTVTLPRLGTLRTHETTEALARKLAEGRARILSATVSRSSAGSCPSRWRSTVTSPIGIPDRGRRSGSMSGSKPW